MTAKGLAKGPARPKQMSLRLRSEATIRLSAQAERELVAALAALLRAAATRDHEPDGRHETRRDES